MGDQHIQTLRRRWAETGSVEDESRYLAELVRTNLLSQDRVELAALLGYPAAQFALPLEFAQTTFWTKRLGGVVAPPHVPLNDPREALTFMIALIRHFSTIVFGTLQISMPDALVQALASLERHIQDGTGGERFRLPYTEWAASAALPIPARAVADILFRLSHALTRPSPVDSATVLSFPLAEIFVRLPSRADEGIPLFLERVRESAPSLGLPLVEDSRLAYEAVVLRGLNTDYVPRRLLHRV